MNTKKELIDFFKTLSNDERTSLGYSQKLSKDEMIEIYNSLNVSRETNEIKPFTIKVLSDVTLSQDLTHYWERGEGELVKYRRGDIIENIHPDYFERFSNAPQFVEILEV